MNALKLADDLNNANGFQYIAQLGLASQAATMLRQQQADLKDADKYALELERLYEDAKAEIESLKANRKHDFGLGEASGFIKGHKENPYKAITNTKIEPTVVSYTHPVKELTDEEIWELHQEHIDEVTCGHSMKTVGFIEFARAILRKAQEK